MVMFGGMVFVWGVANSAFYIHARIPGLYIQVTSSKVNANCFGDSCELMACPETLIT